MPRRKKAKGPAKPKAPPRSATDDLSEYELLRLAHIKRNQEFLASLGLVGDNACAGSSAAASKQSAASKQGHITRKARPKPPPMPLHLRRRSNRVKGETAQYTGEHIDRFGEQIDVACASASGGTKRRAASALLKEGGAGGGEGDDEYDDEGVDYEALKDEIREAAMRHMEAVRAAMLPTLVVDDDCEDQWRAEARRRWGEGAAVAKPGRDWKT